MIYLLFNGIKYKYKKRIIIKILIILIKKLTRNLYILGDR